MKRVYLIRHALPDLPPGERWCIGARSDPPLGTLGRMQAALLAFEPRLRGLSAVYCSHLRRSRETAAALCPDPVPVCGVGEQDMGDWDGLSFREIRARFPELYAARGVDPNLLPQGAEPHAAVRARMERAVLDCAGQCGGDCAIVSHRSAIASLTGQRERLGYGSLSVLETDGVRFAVREVGLVSRPALTDAVCEALLRAAGVASDAVRERAAGCAPPLRAAALLRGLSPEVRTAAAWVRALGYAETAALLERTE